MITDVYAILNVLTSVGLVYIIKEVLDTRPIIERYPFFQFSIFRFFLILVVCAPLVQAIRPSLLVGYFLIDFGMLGSIVVVGYAFANRESHVRT